MDQPPPGLPTIEQITSPLIFGTLFGWALYGALSVQVYIYHLCFSDKLALRIFVYSVYLLDTLQTILSGFDMHYWFSSGYGNPEKLANPYISAFDGPMLDGLISFIVQAYFCYRIWVLSNKSRSLPLFIGAIGLMQFISALILGARAHIVGSFVVTHSPSSIRLLYIWAVGSLVADALIAMSMIYLLLRARSTIAKTNLIITRLVQLVLETNLLTAVVAFLVVIIFAAFPDKNYFICPTLFLGKLYTNTLMVTLNNRLFIGRSKPSQAATSGSVRMHLPRFAVRSDTQPGTTVQLDTMNSYPDQDSSRNDSDKQNSRPSM